MHINTFILTSFMILMHRRYFIFWMERAPRGLDAARGAEALLTAQVCPETWRFPCLWRTGRVFQFFPVHLTVLSGTTKAKWFLDNDYLKYSKTLYIFIFLSMFEVKIISKSSKCYCLLVTCKIFIPACFKTTVSLSCFLAVYNTLQNARN